MSAAQFLRCQVGQRDELWQALEFLHADRFATPIGAGNKAAVPVQPLLKVMAKHLKGEEKLRHATVTEILVP
jgi:bifunctional non-homologous end joining protein LigD